jgi:hypothetical protein
MTLEEYCREEGIPVPPEDAYRRLKNGPFWTFSLWCWRCNPRGKRSYSTYRRHARAIKEVLGFDITKPLMQDVETPYRLDEVKKLVPMVVIRPVPVEQPPDFYYLPPIDQSFAVK